MFDALDMHQAEKARRRAHKEREAACSFHDSSRGAKHWRKAKQADREARAIKRALRLHDFTAAAWH